MTPTMPNNNWQAIPAVRGNVGLFIGIAGGTASGKTMSAMMMAEGIVGPGNRFLVIDTESKRALHYADDFAFDHIEFDAPYSSERYADVVKYGFHKGYRAIVLDSFSHEHYGVGGYLDYQASTLETLIARAKEKPYNKNKSDYELADKLTPLSWSQPVKARKRMLGELLACSATIPIIFCMRAEEKSFMSEGGKLVTRPTPEWEPVCGKNMMFEMTVSFMLHSKDPGMPEIIKIEGQHRPLFPPGHKLNAECGRRIAEWAKGGAKPAMAPAVTRPAPAPSAIPIDPAASKQILDDYLNRIDNCATKESLQELWPELGTVKAQMTATNGETLKQAGSAKAEQLKQAGG